MSIPEKLKNIKILIVEDDETVRELSKAILNGCGFNNAWETDNAKSALSLLKNQHFDLVICDWQMPNMTGLQLLQEVRKDRRIKHVAFLMATAIADMENVKIAIQEGVTDYITKPLQPDVLCNKVVTTYAKGLDKRGR